jgi:non-haem Fe2+, alpha-ketoglutarate-dependent halogenase
MIDCPTLTEKEIISFHKNGFIGPFTIYSPAEAKYLLAEIRKKNQNKEKAIFENNVNYDRHFDIPELAEHIAHPGIVGRLKSILAQNILCWRTEFFPKFPGAKATEWHQVFDYSYANGQAMLLPTGNTQDIFDLTVWTAFTEATRENGCMKFIPGTHTRKYYDEQQSIKIGRDRKYQSVIADTGFYGYDFSEFKIEKDWEPEEEEYTPIEMEPGQCIIFTSRCVHASYPNKTKKSTRFAISSRYVPTHVKVYPGQDSFYAHGSRFDLADYGCVLVSGEDSYHYNKLRALDNQNEPFLK